MKNAKKISHLLPKAKLFFLLIIVLYLPLDAGRHGIFWTPLDPPKKPLFVLHLNNYQFRLRDLYKYSNSANKTCALPLNAVKDIARYVRTNYPDLKYPIYPVNAQGFTKASYLWHLKKAFAAGGLNMADRHVLQLVVDYVWADDCQEVRVSVKDVLYLMNGMSLEGRLDNYGKDAFADGSGIKIVPQPSCNQIESSGVIVDIFLRNKLLVIDAHTRKYYFNQQEIKKIPTPCCSTVNILLAAAQEAGGQDSSFQHLTMHCNPDDFIRLARSHMAFLGIEEQKDPEHEKGCMIS